MLGVLSVAFSNWLLSPGHDVAAGVTAGLRVAFFVVPGVLLAARVDPFVLGDHLGQRLRLPARPVVAAVAALQRFESLDQQWHQLRRTRRVRGLDAGRTPLARARQVGALTAGLLVQSLRQAGADGGGDGGARLLRARARKGAGGPGPSPRHGVARTP